MCLKSKTTQPIYLIFNTSPQNVPTVKYAKFQLFSLRLAQTTALTNTNRNQPNRLSSNSIKQAQVRVWNRTRLRAEELCNKLGAPAKVYDTAEACVRGADVIVTVTYATEPIVQADWLKPGVHINGESGWKGENCGCTY